MPTHDELEKLSTNGLFCSDCELPMCWTAHCGTEELVATLQHYRDGKIALVCRSCNTRHASMAGDSYRGMPKDHKQCPHCKEIKPFSMFSADNGRSGKMKLKSWCKQCSSEAHREWRENAIAG